MTRRTVDSGTEWESRVGYSRAVRTGDVVEVSGTTATDEDGAIVGVDDPAAQTRQALANVERALSALDASLDEVVRTRMYVTDIDDWEAVGEAHGEYFGAGGRSDGVAPATSMVEVSRLVDPEMLVEIEAVARVG